MTYDEETTAGRAKLAEGDWRGAYRHFGIAHGIGHDIRGQHLGAHRAQLRASWRGRSPGRIGIQVYLLTAAFVFGRTTSPTAS
ncbi:MAG TPA: DUF3703 domain-containing protein [Pseudonocardiaceae bacterium]|jgi:hypothetical protein|nr:DUF3703 domain-containing protein [Pseudonocardiaceae bacterium]